MQVRRRIGLCVAAGTAVAATALGTPVTAGAAAPGAVTSVEVRGTLLVAQPDGPGAHPSYAIALADGDLVPVRGPFAGVRPLSRFTGRLALPPSVVGRVGARDGAVRAGATLDSGSVAGRDVLALVHSRSLTLNVVGTPRLADPAPAVTPTAHQQYVAAVDNEGALGQDDTALLGHVSTVGSYWQGEADGAISSIGVPATVAHYDTALTNADCGLGGSSFWNVVAEAVQQFPGINPYSGTDQVVLFVPPACASGGVVGEGSIGDSFASGGVLIVKAGTAIEGTYAHETGHNYGFEHANARYAGTSMEYYGVYDVMGFALGGYNQLTALSTPFRVFQGITQPGEIQDVALGDGSAPVHVAATIRPRSDDTGLRSIRVADPATGEKLYLDYRSGTGQDTGAFYTATGYYLNSSKGAVHYAPGVTISAARGGSGVDTLVVDGSGDTSLGAGTTWTNAAGTLSVHVVSLSGTGADVTVDYAPPVISPAPTPTLAGKPRVGSPLTALTGTWMTGVALSYRWYVDGSPVAGATGASYTPVPGDLGRTVRVAVTGTRAGYPSVTETSADSAPVGLGVLTASRPQILGIPAVGKTLLAVAGAWPSGTRLRYAWYADGTRIAHATGKHLRLTRAQRGHRIRVTVTGSHPGFRTRTLGSARTARVS